MRTEIHRLCRHMFGRRVGCTIMHIDITRYIDAQNVRQDKMCFTSLGLFMLITIDTGRHRWLQQTLIINYSCREDSVFEKHFAILSSFVCRYPGYKILTDYKIYQWYFDLIVEINHKVSIWWKKKPKMQQSFR